jgi:eukaryotic-like serine/threonine-protein kinase
VSEELIPGMRVGRYQLLFRLGKGGMGEVWAAASNVSELAFQKLIALKVLRTKEMASNAAKMFFDEAVAASALQHAAIVPTVDLGRDDDVLFIAMDLVRGPSLTALLQRLVINKAALSPATVAHIGIQIASALDYAHGRATFEGKAIRLVHRDVSPHNVLLDLNGAVRLTDFGVARTTIQTHESHVGTVRGKPSYMAPEQVVGGDIDARTDLFSLGIVLWESSSLKRLFGRSNPVKSMDAVLKHNPKPLTEMVSDFPQQLSDVIGRALHKDPNARYQNAAEFVDALSLVLRTLPGASTVERDLSHVIETNFPPEAFDLDGRVHEAMAVSGSFAGQPASNGGDETEGVIDPDTRSMRTPSSAQGRSHQTFVGGLGTKLNAQAANATRVVAWPTAHARDPLAPEAIEEARTQFAERTPSGLNMVIDPGQQTYVAAMGSAASMDNITPAFSQTGASIMVAAQRRSSMGFVLGALSLAALVLLGTAFIVARSGGDPKDMVTISDETVAVQAESNAVRVTQKPTLGDRLVNKAVAAEPTIEPAPEAETAPAIKRDPPAKKAAAPAKRALREEDAPVREMKAAPSSDAMDATRAQVLALIREVKKVDPEAARQMYPTLNEAGDDNVKVLNELRAKARAILSSDP